MEAEGIMLVLMGGLSSLGGACLFSVSGFVLDGLGPLFALTVCFGAVCAIVLGVLLIGMGRDQLFW